jgi:hypothetical protein
MGITQFLEKAELKPKASRVRTKLKKLMQVKIDELYKDEVALLERFGKKDEQGELIQHDGDFILIEETAVEYHQEKAELIRESVSINVDEIRDKLSFLIDGLENSEMSLSGVDAEVLDLLIDKLEEEK